VLLPSTTRRCAAAGYDISELFSVLPEYGNMDDAVRLIEE